MTQYRQQPKVKYSTCKNQATLVIRAAAASYKQNVYFK